MLKLGIIIKNDQVVNHRSLRKILLNPIFLFFGFQISSVFKEKEFITYKIIKNKMYFNLFRNYYYSFLYKNDDIKIIKEHL